MKLTYVCGFAWEPKGTVRARAFPLAEEMVRRGHEVTLIIAPYDNVAHSGREFVANGVRVINLEIASTRIPDLARIAGELVRGVEGTSPDVVHVFKPKGLAGIAATRLLMRGGVPVVIDCDDWEGWGGWNEVKSYPWVMKEFIDLHERWLIRKATAVTAASKVLVERSSDIRRAADVSYVPNGPTSHQLQISKRLPELPPPEHKRRLGFPDWPMIFYAGHFDPADDVMFFCRVASQVAAHERMTLVFAGEGPELEKARAWFSDFPEAQVSFLGTLEHERYAGVLAASDICAFPYPDTPVYRAKCSARIIDYMLFAKPVVTTNVGQNPEYIIHEESGLLTATGDEREFEEALTRLVREPELRARLGANARERILNQFAWSGAAGHNCETAYQRVRVPVETARMSLAS